MNKQQQIREKIADVYKWIGEQIEQKESSGLRCGQCGKCCDFKNFDHRLFVTLVELMYLPSGKIEPMPGGVCPYNENGKCGIYEWRFAGCRIFSCKADSDFQSRLSEKVIEKIKSIGSEFHIEYQYTDLPTALNGTAC